MKVQMCLICCMQVFVTIWRCVYHNILLEVVCTTFLSFPFSHIVISHINILKEQHIQMSVSCFFRFNVTKLNKKFVLFLGNIPEHSVPGFAFSSV